MQFIPEGPDIPEHLLNAHADGDVVFFCGAGVSVDAGYPLFAKLVNQLRDLNPISDTPELDDAISNRNFDFALSILEKQIGTGGMLRTGVRDILSVPPLTLRVHEILLDLVTQGHGNRLVTTNFDRLFIQADEQNRFSVDAAPRLPIPKKKRWNSVVHLHGLLSEKSNDVNSLSDLVLTSADFGEAYITDGYCSRFVVELLRNFTVVFIGYSLSDPVMRYLLDAISVAQLRDGSSFRQPYAFISHSAGKMQQVLRAWEHRPVKVIPYLTKQQGKHFRLYKTLKAWAELAAGGQRARETLALNEGQKPYLAEDSFTAERLLWALRDESGKAAKALADTPDQTADVKWLPVFAKNGLLDQVYSLAEWIEVVSKNGGRTNKDIADIEYRGSVTRGGNIGHLKPTTIELLRWMQRHLRTVELADWFLTNGGVPHPAFSNEYSHPGNKRHRQGLGPDHRLFWDILTSDAYRISHSPVSYWSGLRDALNLSNPIAAKELLSNFALRLDIQPSPYREFEQEELEANNKNFLKSFRFELKLADQSFDHRLKQLVGSSSEIDGLETLAEPLTDLIISSLGWLKIVGASSEFDDGSGYSIPSISPHDQNKFVEEFGQLVFLLRDSFVRLSRIDRARAISLAQRWDRLEYPVFRRLFFYAALEIGEPLDASALCRLLANEGADLWRTGIQREVNRYLRRRVSFWTTDQISKLVGQIQLGPSRTTFPDVEQDRWSEFREREIVSLLKKLAQGEIAFPVKAKTLLTELTQKFPSALPDDHSDEFVIYSGGARGVHWDEDVSPGAFSLFIKLTSAERVEHWQPDNADMFRKLAVESPEAAIATMEEAIKFGLPEPRFWREGFYGLATNLKTSAATSQHEQTDGGLETTTIALMRRAVDTLETAPEVVLQAREVAHAVVQFWRDAPVADLTMEKYLSVWDRIWTNAVSTPMPEAASNGAVSLTINDPGGELSEQLIGFLWPADAKVGSGLPNDLASRISTAVRRTDHSRFDPSSVIAASRLEIMHAVDPPWAEREIIPLLDWGANPSAAAYWEGFLWPARISPDLFKALKPYFLEAMRREEDIDVHSYGVLCQMLVLASLEMQSLSLDEAKAALGKLSQKALHHVSGFVRQRVLNSKANSAAYWERTVGPWLSRCWPRDASKRSDQIAEDFAMASLYCGAKFPDAMRWFERNQLFRVLPQASTILHALDRKGPDLHEDFAATSSLIEKFPADVLHLIWICRPFQWDHDNTARTLLTRMVHADASLIDDPEYRDLDDLLPN
ncbi:hypothetical protein X759_14115 [Mesorhizobium sp. LSHC420B00]|uniref:SIR2 family protein n=1 Tax=unclassified Mesorhizobium TaxID=325217 RepID=UPI0003CEA51D|nr:SIR2 family protein [Mesorhizobium sp. LSHC420B00]ESX80266.1 hypothetical protein X759_14115 [Mesorhizobium sp. LSHC420B00]